MVLEFLHKVVDALEDYLGSPLLGSKIEANYDIVAQLLNEMCDDGFPFTTEPNALRDVVLPPSLMGKLLGSVTGLPRFAYRACILGTSYNVLVLGRPPTDIFLLVDLSLRPLPLRQPSPSLQSPGDALMSAIQTTSSTLI